MEAKAEAEQRFAELSNNRLVLRHVSPLTAVEASARLAPFYGMSITSFDCSQCYFQEAGMCRPLSRFIRDHNKTITDVNISHCQFDTEKKGELITDFLKGNDIIRSLNLDYVGLGEVGAIAICKALMAATSIQTLILSTNGLTLPGFKSFAEFFKANRSLTHLNLSFNNIGVEGIGVIGDILKTNKTIKHLRLDANQFGPTGAIRLAQGLRENKTIEYLSVYACVIGDQGSKAIFEALTSSQTIKELRVGRCFVGETGLNAAIGFLKENDSVTAIDFSRCYIGALGGKLIAPHLSKLRSINLSYCNLGDEGIQEMLQHLKGSKTVNSLCLGRNFITDLNARAIVAYIEASPSLKNSELFQNHFKNGGKIISDCLKVNRTLTRFSIFENEMSKNISETFIEAIEINTNIEEFSLDYQSPARTAPFCERNKVHRRIVAVMSCLNPPKDAIPSAPTPAPAPTSANISAAASATAPAAASPALTAASSSAAAIIPASSAAPASMSVVVDLPPICGAAFDKNDIFDLNVLLLVLEFLFPPLPQSRKAAKK